MPTIDDVAREAGVGIGTVSRVFNGSDRVSEEARRRVRAAAERLGYRPSSVARAFSRGRTHTVEVIVPILTRYFYVEILRGMETGLETTDYSLVIRTIEHDHDRERVFKASGVRGRADGVLFTSIELPDELVQRLRRDSFPAVVIDGSHEGLSSVTVDQEQAGMAAAEHCIELGHRRIALIDRPHDPFAPPSQTGRERGFRRAIEAADLAIPRGYVMVEDFSPEGGARGLQLLAELPDRPTAVLTGSDMQAMGVLDTARRLGWRIPEDLSVVGYHDIELAQYLGLTTVRVPMRELGRRGVELLVDAIEHPERQPQTILLPTELVVRRTCAPPGSRPDLG